MNYLRIEGLRIEARIGVHAWEKKIKQALLIDLEIPTDFSQIDDKIERAIDYDALCQHVTELVQSTQFNLIETVATHIQASLQTTFKIKTATIRVSKPHAIHNANNICVEIKHAKD
ncbi:MAG: dihydroneopterin aldolase [Legionellaceae bacterium]|nr:dihydroneopterin aldolase [Legionellaceae bacterium]